MAGDESTANSITISDNAAGGTNTYTAIAVKLSSTFEAIWFWAIAKATETITLSLNGGNGISTDTLLTAVFRNSLGALSGNPLRGSAQQSAAGTTAAAGVTSTGLAGTVAGDLIVSLTDLSRCRDQARRRTGPGRPPASPESSPPALRR